MFNATNTNVTHMILQGILVGLGVIVGSVLSFFAFIAKTTQESSGGGLPWQDIQGPFGALVLSVALMFVLFRYVQQKEVSLMKSFEERISDKDKQIEEERRQNESLRKEVADLQNKIQEYLRRE